MVSEFSVKRPLIVFAAVMLAILPGIYALLGASGEITTEDALPGSLILIEYPDADAQTVELELTDPLTRKIADDGAVHNVRGVSDAGRSILLVEFADGTDAEEAAVSLSEKIGWIQTDLDGKIATPSVIPVNPGEAPLMIAAVRLDGLTSAQASAYVSDAMIPELEKIDGAYISLSGTVREYIKISLNAEKTRMLNEKIRADISARFDETEVQILEALSELEDLRAPGLMGNAVYYNPEYQIQLDKLNAWLAQLQTERTEAEEAVDISSTVTLDTVKKLLENNGFSVSLETAEDGGKLHVDTGNAPDDLEKIRALTLFTPDFEGAGAVRLGEAADTETVAFQESYANIDGNDGMILFVRKHNEASGAKVFAEAERMLNELEENNPALHITLLSERGAHAKNAASAILKSLLSGALLSVILLFLFLRKIGLTLTAVLGSSCGLLLSVSAIYTAGIPLNIFTLGAAAAGLGISVCACLAAAENINRLRTEGLAPETAAVAGSRQFGGTFAASAVMALCAFLPALFTGGLTRRMTLYAGLAALICAACGILISLTLIPALVYALRKIRTRGKRHKLFSALSDIYSALLEKILIFKAAPILAVLTILALSVWGVYGREAGRPDTGEMILSVSVPGDADVREAAGSFSELISGIGGIEAVGVTQSAALPGNTFTAYLNLEDGRKIAGEEILNLIRKKTDAVQYSLTPDAMPDDIPGAAHSLSPSDEIGSLAADIPVLLLVLAAAIIYVAALVGLRRLLMPLAVLLTLLLSLPGALLPLLLTGTGINAAAALGFLCASGFILVNSMLFARYFDALLNGGADKHSAADVAARKRLRPVLMTLTAAATLLPAALGIWRDAFGIKLFAISAAGGIIYGSLITIFILPALCTLLRPVRRTGKAGSEKIEEEK